MYGVKLLLVLIVVAGIIAYVGDKIGMKVGKKRLSLFGLRPKHTSIIVTVVTGIMIALVSLALLMIASEDVRMALLDMDALLGKISILKEDILSMQDEKEELELNLNKMILQKELLEEQVDNLGHNIGVFGNRYVAYLTEEIIYKKGDIIASTSIDLDDNSDNRIEMNNLLSLAVEAVREKGILLEGNKLLDYSRRELEGIYKLLDKKNGNVIVRLIARHNTLRDERVKVSFYME